MDDDMQTPIAALRTNNEQMNYQEQLRGAEQTNMRTQLEQDRSQNNQQSYGENNQQFIPMTPPMVQSRNNMYMNQDGKKSTKESTFNPQNVNDKQREFILIVVLCSLLYSTPVQEQIKKVMPTLYNSTNPTIVGTLFNGAMIGGMFYVLKNVNISF